jgi:hypothetical protein
MPGETIMKRFFAMCMILGLALPFAGCDKKAETKKTETTVTTPEGSATVTDTHKVQTTGENPPAVK